VTPAESKHLAPGERPPNEAQTSVQQSVATAQTLLAMDPPAVRVLAPRPTPAGAPSSGVRSTIERPPRA
jgi:hypothetical protein